MLVDYNINNFYIPKIAYNEDNDIFHQKRYRAGDKDEDKPVYNQNEPNNEYPILIIENDIVNLDGYGLKKGFYELRISSDFDFIVFIQSGRIVAKIPIIKLERIDDNPKVYDKKGKKKKKYKFGKSPDSFVHKNAEIFIDKKTNNYIIFYEFKNVKATGVMIIK